MLFSFERFGERSLLVAIGLPWLAMACACDGRFLRPLASASLVRTDILAYDPHMHAPSAAADEASCHMAFTIICRSFGHASSHESSK